MDRDYHLDLEFYPWQVREGAMYSNIGLKKQKQKKNGYETRRNVVETVAFEL